MLTVRDSLAQGLKATEKTTGTSRSLDIGGEAGEDPVHVQLAGVADHF
jgi:hypothetical protein